MNEKNLRWYMSRKIIIKSAKIIRLVENFLDKARKNLITASILSEIEKSGEVRRLLKVPKDYSCDEWVVIAAYYAMYMAALVALAKLGFRSKNHDATILALEEFFVRRGLLGENILRMIKDAKLEVEYIRMIRIAKDRREIAQYAPTKRTTKLLAEETMRNSYEFVERIEDLISSIKA